MARQESKAKALEGGSPVPGAPKAYTHKAEVGLGLPKERAEAMEVACGIPKTGRTPTSSHCALWQGEKPVTLVL